MKSFLLKILPQLAVGLFLTLPLTAQQLFSGQVFLDANKNLIKDADEKEISGVLVSNGRDIVKTDRKGEWKLLAQGEESIFIIKPSSYQIPASRSMVPQHFLGNNTNDRTYNFPLWIGKKSEEL